MRFARSFGIGWGSVRANARPLVMLWLFAVLLVICYYNCSSFEGFLEPVARWQMQCGWRAAFANGFVFCGVLPFVFLVIFRSLRVRRPLATLAVQSLWAGVCGIVSGWMYELNAIYFGDGSDLELLLVKTAVCQFVWTPLFFNPFGSAVYYWIGHDFFHDGMERLTLAAFWKDVALPNLIMNWALWIPCTFAVLMFPTALQVQLSGLINSMFCLIQLWIGGSRWKKC